MGPFKSCRLLSCNASDNELGGVDDRKARGIVAALEIKRLVLGGVDMLICRGLRVAWLKARR